MKKTLLAGIGVLTIFTVALAYDVPLPEKTPVIPTDEETNMVDIGISYHQGGMYEQAMQVYSDVLEKNPENVEALYEMSYSCFAAGDYEKSLEYATRGAEYKSDLLIRLYGMIGNNLDMLGYPADAIDVFSDAIETNPDEYLLYYNRAVTNIRLNKITQARDDLTAVVRLNPNHSSSLVGLADLVAREGKQVPALLLTCRFLFLEPNTGRTSMGHDFLNFVMAMGVEEDEDGQLNVEWSGGTDNDSPYAMAELVYRMARAGRKAEGKSEKSELELRTRELDLLFGVFAADTSAKPDEFTADILWPYYAEMSEKGFAEIFAYYIHQSSGLKGVGDWLKNNSARVDSLIKWDDDYDWGP